MQSKSRKNFYFQTDANALGGFLEKPFQKIIPSCASASLPPTGGYVETRSEGFNFEEILSCSSAYTRVSGREVEKNGPWSLLVTSVVEGLSILEVVTAERIVGQISVEYFPDGRPPRIVHIGSRFEGLRIGGYEVHPKMNPVLMSVGGDAAGVGPAAYQETGRTQAGKLIASAKQAGEDTVSWIEERFGWMAADRGAGNGGLVLCSLVDGIEEAFPGRSYGHVVEIPEFGRVFLGEMLLSGNTIQFSMVRAELGCNVHGSASAASGVVGGHTVPPG
jgi:hypothetical protein